MAVSRQWTEWHLTPAGWVSGSSRRDGEGNVWRDEPEERVITFVYQEQIDKDHPSRMSPCRNPGDPRLAADPHRPATRPAWSVPAEASREA